MYSIETASAHSYGACTLLELGEAALVSVIANIPETRLPRRWFGDEREGTMLFCKELLRLGYHY